MTTFDGRPVLHICSDFAKQRIYSQLVHYLCKQGVPQMIFMPTRRIEEATVQSINESVMVQYRSRNILRPLHRVFFRTKIRTVYKTLISSFDVRSVGVVHAHFLYSDGAVALKLKRTLGLPYLVAVRNTDLNYFMRYRPDLRQVANRVLIEASWIVFLSPAYRRELLSRVGRRVRARIEHKTLTIPNGLAPEWLDAPHFDHSSGHKRLRLLYVGDFSKNKNLQNTLCAARNLAANRAVELTLVGGGGNAEQGVRLALESGSFQFAKYIGRVDDPDQLRRIYREHDIFVMPSFTETFGVTYIEALSQGLPVVYSRGQGIDGLFPEGTICEAVNPHDPEDIARKIALLAERRHKVRSICIDAAQSLDWRFIAKRYADVYRSTLGSRWQLSRL